MKLGMHLEQKQIISQQMIQTLKVLEMNVTELEAYLTRLSAENPVVELEPSEYRKETEDLALARQAEFERKLEWLSSADCQNRTYYADDAPDQGLNAVQDPASSGETLAEHLHTQLLLKEYTARDFRILDFMARSLDSRGYFTEPLAIVTEHFSVTEDEAESLLEGMRTAISGDVDALYVLSRCKEDREEWQAVEPLYYAMISLWDALRDKGLDAETFRKIRYRLAILNERVYHDPGAGLMRQLMAENPAYASFHAALRWMLQANEEAVKEAALEEDNPLVDMIISGKATEEEFLARVDAARKGRTVEWQAYRRFVNNLKLAMPC